MAEQMETEKEVPGDEIEIDTQRIRERILHILKVYPIISPTMLQSGLGPQVKPEFWRPVLTDLIATGEVLEEAETLVTPHNRHNTYTRLRLPGVRCTGAANEADLR